MSTEEIKRLLTAKRVIMEVLRNTCHPQLTLEDIYETSDRILMELSKRVGDML